MRILTAALVLAISPVAVAAAAPKPNVLVIYADDMGYADLGCTGNMQVKTPHIDSLAADGVRFTNSYVTGCVCSPSRAGLMSGRYQQRFGFDANAEGRSPEDRGPRALDLGQTIFPQRMKALGYATGLVGKWHLGAEKGYLPYQRGFDEFYGFLPFGIGANRRLNKPVPMWRNDKEVEVPEDHTTAFGKEAEAFIDRHKGGPWFLYLAFNAVHAPHVAPDSYIQRFRDVPPPQARYDGMLACLDDAIGGVLAKLRAAGVENDTLIFFASDNGGPESKVVNNGAFRGGKWTVWEGGIRSPVLVRWKGHIPGGRTIAHPVNQLDWLPTAVAAAGGEPSGDWKLDGTNLLPLLEGKTDAAPHDALYWRFGVQYAVRQGDWKLVKPSLKDEPHLFNVTADPGEKTDLAAREPERVKKLQSLWDAWNAKNEPPRWIDTRWNSRDEVTRQAGGGKPEEDE